MSIPLETGPKVEPLIPEEEQVSTTEAKGIVDGMTDEQKRWFLQELDRLLEKEQNVLVGERDTKRNKLEYNGYCNGTREKQRRLDRRTKVYSKGC